MSEWATACSSWLKQAAHGLLCSHLHSTEHYNFVPVVLLGPNFFKLIRMLWQAHVPYHQGGKVSCTCSACVQKIHSITRQQACLGFVVCKTCMHIADQSGLGTAAWASGWSAGLGCVSGLVSRLEQGRVLVPRFKTCGPEYSTGSSVSGSCHVPSALHVNTMAARLALISTRYTPFWYHSARPRRLIKYF